MYVCSWTSWTTLSWWSHVAERTPLKCTRCWDESSVAPAPLPRPSFRPLFHRARSCARTPLRSSMLCWCWRNSASSTLRSRRRLPTFPSRADHSLAESHDSTCELCLRVAGMFPSRWVPLFGILYSFDSHFCCLHHCMLTLISVTVLVFRCVREVITLRVFLIFWTFRHLFVTYMSLNTLFVRLHVSFCT